MIQWLNPYGYYIEHCLLVLMLAAVSIFAGMVITATLEQAQAQPVILEAQQAIDQGWPAEWED